MTCCKGMFFFTMTTRGRVIFLKVEKLASPFSSGFIGKYFLSAGISSGFGAEKSFQSTKTIIPLKVKVNLKITDETWFNRKNNVPESIGPTPNPAPITITMSK